MIKFLTTQEVINIVIFLFVALILAAYRIAAKKGSHRLKLPVGFFIFYFLTEAALTIFRDLPYETVIEGLSLASTVFLSLGIIRLVIFVIFDYLLLYKQLISVPLITRDIGLVVVYLFVILVILRYKANVNLASLITTSAVLTVVIGLALQDTLGNMFSGIVLQLEKPYNIGDWVKFDTYTGKIVGMSWKSTKILTRDKEIVCIPNNLIAKSHILNYSEPDPTHIAAIKISASYNDPPNRVREVILTTLLEHPSIHQDPPPEVRVTAYSDSAIDYLIRFFISDFENEDKIKSFILNQIWYRFRRKGITIPFPIRTIQHKEPDAKKETTEKERSVKTALEHLRQIDIFNALSEKDLSQLAGRVRFDTFASGEIIIRQGRIGKSMFAIISGECDVLLRHNDVDEHSVATLGPNQFFGEMSLLTGEPRTATIRAKTDMVCIRINKENLEDILKQHQDIALKMSEILASRKQQLEAQKGTIDEAARKTEQTHASQLFLKIKAFFNI